MIDIAAKTDAEVVRRWRRALGLTQAEVALVFGMSQRQWNRYETGAAPFPKKKRAWELLLVQQSYGDGMADLLGDLEKMKVEDIPDDVMPNYRRVLQEVVGRHLKSYRREGERLREVEKEVARRRSE